MEFLGVVIVAALTFGTCYLFDKGFAKAFRGKAQHRTGLAVRLNKRYAVIGVILVLLGVLAFGTAVGENGLLLAGGVVVLLMGVGLLTYYMSFGVFYDEDSFLLTTFGKKTVEYRFCDIQMQQLYVLQGGGVIVELHLKDGNAVSIQSGMEGAYPFLDHAFAAWCRQTGRRAEECTFHDPSRSLWFPSEEEA